MLKTVCESLWDVWEVWRLLDSLYSGNMRVCERLRKCDSVEYAHVQLFWKYLNLLQAISVCTTSLNDAGQVIQLLSGKTTDMSCQIRDKLNTLYGVLSGNVHVMNQVKVTRRGVPGMPLTDRNCKAMLHKVFQELKNLCECTNLGKALAK